MATVLKISTVKRLFASNACHRVLRSTGSGRGFFFAVLIVFQATVWAQDSSGGRGWRITPALSIGEHYSDNVSLSPAGSERSEWTTRISPSVTVVGNSARLRVTATYTPELLYRAQQGTTDVSHYLTVLGNAELLSRTLFLETRANVSQQNISASGSQAQSNLNTTTNRTTVRSYSLSPYLRHDFGVDASGELRFTHDAVEYGTSNGAASNSTSTRFDARLTSGPAFRLFNWGLALNRSNTEYNQTNQKIDSESISASVGRLITSDVRVNANFGYEDSGYPTTSGRELKGIFWNIGPEWKPSERTTVSALIGRRYSGPSRTLHVEHRSRLSFWKLDYSESVTNTRSSLTLPAAQDTAVILDALFLSQFPDPVARQAAVQAFIINSGLPSSLTQPLNFLTDSLFLEKRLIGSVGINGVRNTLVANLFTSNRSSLTTSGATSGDFNSSQNVKQTGSSLAWTSQLSGSLTSNVSLSFTSTDFSGLNNRRDRLAALRFGLSKQFHPKLTGSFSLARLKNDSNTAGVDYLENSISAAVGMKF